MKNYTFGLLGICALFASMCYCFSQVDIEKEKSEKEIKLKQIELQIEQEKAKRGDTIKINKDSTLDAIINLSMDVLPCMSGS